MSNIDEIVHDIYIEALEMEKTKAKIQALLAEAREDTIAICLGIIPVEAKQPEHESARLELIQWRDNIAKLKENK